MKTFERGDAGKGRETRAIEYPQPSQRISYHPYAAPLHRIKTDDMLPVGPAVLPASCLPACLQL